MTEKLAIEGGKPVREKKLPHCYPGAAVYGQEEILALSEVVKSQSPFRYYGPGNPDKVRRFEAALRNKIGRSFCVAVTSCTASLIVALKGAGIGIGDKVIVPAVTFIATAGAVVCAGAVPVFCDMDDSFNMNPECIESLIDSETKAIITVPLQGNPCQMDEIMSIAKKHGLIVIEDVAQSAGSKFRGKYSGSFGDIGCFSLQMNKIITTGEGGAVLTDNFDFYKRSVRYHDQGMFRDEEGFLSSEDNGESFLGQNYRMSEFTGAVALEQLKKLDDILQKMRRIKKMIKEEIRNIPGLTFRRIVDEEGDCGSAILFTLPTREKAAAFRTALNAENIAANYLYGGLPAYMQPQILHQRTAEKNHFPFNMVNNRVTYTPKMCPYALQHMPLQTQLSISPLYTDDDAKDIITAVHKVAGQILR